ncbi:MAG: PucR family transcriptional regulator ligand-binding domain-containing protein [Clostridiaceae bacterium]|nr:PucR family transcriptional regulator ligand-binding domain-containing protein [Eubacteriales bacterium]
MSVSIKEILQLPCMNGAKVVAGKDNLSQTVTTVTVMEYSHPGDLQNEMNDKMGYRGSEISLSGFFNIRDDVQAQCELIRSFNEVGIVAIILYYVGIWIKKIDAALVQTADELGIVIIVMPEGQMGLRYSDAIMEVSELIYKSKEAEKYFIPEILDRFSLLPEHQRNMDILLRLICNRIQASIILTDSEWRVMYYATWPSGVTVPAQKLANQAMCGGDTAQLGDHTLCSVTHRVGGQNIIALGENREELQSNIAQIDELVQLFMNIWGSKQGAVCTDELIRTIIMGESMKAKRLSELIGIDIQQIDTMFVLRPDDRMHSDETIYKMLNMAREAAQDLFENSFSGTCEDSVVLFAKSLALQNMTIAKNHIADIIHNSKMNLHVFLCNNMTNISKCRNAYVAIKENAPMAIQLYPQKTVISLQEVKFAAHLEALIREGESGVAERLEILGTLDGEDKQLSCILLETLAVYLLDADANIEKTAALLFVHKNTVKYRIGKINKKMRFHIDEMPQRIELYTAVALKRVLY